MEWWGWLLLAPVVLVLLFVWVVMLAIGDALIDLGSEKVLRHKAITGRIERRPGLFRIGGVLIGLGLVPVVATIGALLKDQYDPAPGTMPVLALVVAALISLGMVIWLIWWRIAEPER